MAIPVYLQQFKAAGIYRVVFDKSTVAGVDSEILRLVVGYSEKGPFNIPVYVKSISDFKAIYGDVSKKLEKRGIYFHRLAMQALATGPILALNLKKFDDETVSAATISTDVITSGDSEAIRPVQISVSDIYDTTRFWEISADKLNGLRPIAGPAMDKYINISAINTKETSGTYFIRKASGNIVNSYNVTVSDWYRDGQDVLPEYLEGYEDSLISDFFAEVFVFNGKFVPSQVLASQTLKNYFSVDMSGDEPELYLKDHVTNAYGDYVDTLTALYNDETSGAVGHYVGCLIPNFKDKYGRYVSLDIVFNTEEDVHNMMMSFNTDLLEDESVRIDISGRKSINKALLTNVLAGDAKTTVLGNTNAPIIYDTVSFSNNLATLDGAAWVTNVALDTEKPGKVFGTLYVADADDIVMPDAEGNTEYSVTLTQLDLNNSEDVDTVKITFENADLMLNSLNSLGIHKDEDSWVGDIIATDAVDVNDDNLIEGVKTVVTSILNLDKTLDEDGNKHESKGSIIVSSKDVASVTSVSQSAEGVFGSSLSFVTLTSGWSTATASDDGEGYTLTGTDSTLYDMVSVGDCFVAANEDATDVDGLTYVTSLSKDKDGGYVITFTGAPYTLENSSIKYFVKVDSSLNQETGKMVPQYLEGYTFKHNKPESTSMFAKLQWQKNWILSALVDYSGLRTALLDKANIDYRYVVDTFESYVEGGCKNILSALCKDKQSAFAILNFPSVKTFIKCPYTSFTDANGIFRVEYVVAGMNKKKIHDVKFDLPSEADGASFCAFYTPLKFSDGYVDTIVPSAALVSNLFMEKYTSRQPYYIIAGPNYGSINAAGLVGPDYTYSQDELQVIEPFGVNCMIYRPNFGTFINANQTAKQTPVSALSRVNVRELVIYLQDEIEKVLQSYQWEFNNPTTRTAILDRANLICARVAANGGIQEYLNVMDESNNTPEIIDNEMAILSTHIEPGMGCGKMVQELTLYRSGQLSSVIKD